MGIVLEALIVIVVATILGVLSGLYFVAGVGVALACLIGFGIFVLALIGIGLVFSADGVDIF